MRPTPSRSASQDPSSILKGTKAWGLQQDQQQQQQPQQEQLSSTLNDPSFHQSFDPTLQQQQPSNFVNQDQKNGTSRVYSIEELLLVWQEVQDKMKNGESVESYRSLSPIKTLVEQVERDRSLQGNLKKDDPHVAEITEKLNEFTRWVKNENPTATTSTSNSNSGLNMSRLMSREPSAASPFLAQKPLLNENPLHSPYGMSSGDLSLSQNSLNLLQPQQLKWYYLDPFGNQQGPFDGPLMHEWYTSGYLAADLNLRREEEFTYYPLQQFAISINNFVNPFLTPLPNLAPQPQSVPFQHSLSFDQQIPGLFNQGIQHQPQPQSQISQIQNSQQNWTTNSGRSSPWVNNSTLANDPIATQDFRIGAQSPFMNSSFNNQSTSSLAKSTVDTTVQNDHDDLLNQIHSKVLDNVLQDEETPRVPENQGQSVSAPKEKSVSVKSEDPSTKESVSKSSTANNTGKKSTPAVTKSTSSKPASTQQDPKPIESKVTSNVSSTATASETAKLLKPETSKPAAPKLAPWANKSVSKAPQLTLEQIQKLEAEESEKQAKAKAKQDKLLAAQLLATTEKSIVESEAPKTSLPSTASWGTPTKSKAAPTKTLLDIQREEEEEAAKAAAKASAAASNNSSSSTSVKKAPSAKGSFASIATSSVPASNAWTVVSSARKPAAPKVQAPKITSTPKPVTPEVLRSVSSSTAAQIQPTTTYTKTVSPRQDFLAWCRSSMKLNKGVNKEEVLQVMLMLPVGAESQEIIADTIYSNSSTMDGRRFAQEFMKRRKSVEDQSHDGLSWNEALRISAENDDDGWDFQVVGKKKKGRN